MFSKRTGKLEQLTGRQAYLLHTTQVFILTNQDSVLRAQYGGKSPQIHGSFLQNNKKKKRGRSFPSSELCRALMCNH